MCCVSGSDHDLGAGTLPDVYSVWCYRHEVVHRKSNEVMVARYSATQDRLSRGYIFVASRHVLLNTGRMDKCD